MGIKGHTTAQERNDTHKLKGLRHSQIERTAQVHIEGAGGATPFYPPRPTHGTFVLSELQFHRLGWLNVLGDARAGNKRRAASEKLVAMTAVTCLQAFSQK